MNFSQAQEEVKIKEELLLDLKGYTHLEYAILILREDYSLTFESIAQKLNLSRTYVLTTYHLAKDK